MLLQVFVIGGPTIKFMSAATTPFGFLKDLPQRDEDLPLGIVEELKMYTADFKEHDGLLIGAACPDLLGVSQQRFSQLKKEYNFWNKDYFGKTMYSRRQLEDFYKVRRAQGKPGHNASAAIKAVLSSSGDK
jgi:hypothetical protein